MNRPASSRERPYVICVRSFVPKLIKSTVFAISCARRAALGVSTITPREYFTCIPVSDWTDDATASTRALTNSTSRFAETRGIIISGLIIRPVFFCTKQAASNIALACIT